MVREDDVWRAADELLASEENPTVERVRARLGGGSQTTIVKYLKTWRSERDGPERLQIPNVPEPVVQAFRACWLQAAQDARAWAEAEYQERRDALARESDAAQALVENASKAESAARHQADVLTERVTHIEEGRSAAQYAADAASEALDAERAAHEKSRSRSQEQERKLIAERSELMEAVAVTRKALADALRHHRADIRTYQQALAEEKSRYEADTGHWALKVDAIDQRRQQAEASLADERADLQKTNAELERVTEAFHRVEADNGQLHDRLDRAEEELAKSRQERETERNEAQSAVADRMGLLADTQQSIKDMIQMLGDERRSKNDDEEDSKTPPL